MFHRLFLLPIVIGLAACNSQTAGNVPGDAEDGEPFSMIAEDATLRLVGTEPFWGARIAGGSMNYNTPENIDETEFAVTRFAGRGGLSFSGVMEGAQVDVLVTPGECSDGMSDSVFPFNATVEIDGMQRTGCAYREGEDDIGSP